jgi:hypothetical protein
LGDVFSDQFAVGIFYPSNSAKGQRLTFTKFHIFIMNQFKQQKTQKAAPVFSQENWQVASQRIHGLCVGCEQHGSIKEMYEATI